MDTNADIVHWKCQESEVFTKIVKVAILFELNLKLYVSSHTGKTWSIELPELQ